MALIWFFQEAKSAGMEAEFDHEPEALEDWEKKLVTRLRVEKKAFRTEKTYRYWCRRCCRFWSPIGPADFREMHLTQFLDNLAVKQKVLRHSVRRSMPWFTGFEKSWKLSFRIPWSTGKQHPERVCRWFFPRPRSTV